jgi:hypothetical protein
MKAAVVFSCLACLIGLMACAPSSPNERVYQKHESDLFESAKYTVNTQKLELTLRDGTVETYAAVSQAIAESLLKSPDKVYAQKIKGRFQKQ